MKKIIRIHLLLFLAFISFSNDALANKEWISIEKEDNKLEGIRIICSVQQNSLRIKEIKTLIESPIINRENQYFNTGNKLYLTLNQKDTIKILSIKRNSELVISHHKYGNLRLIPFNRYKQVKYIKEIKELLLSNIININFNENEFYFDINRDSICVDTSMSLYGQLYYIEIFDEEVFLVLTRMFGPILHIKEYNQHEIIANMYNGRIPYQMKLRLQEESNERFRKQLNGKWISTIDQASVINLDCQIKKDTIIFSKNKCYFNNFCYISTALWDVCHNGKFIAFREFDKNYNEYKMPEKLSFRLINNERLEIEVPFRRGRNIGREWKTFNRINND